MAVRLNLRPHSLVKRKGVVVVGEQVSPYVCLRNGDEAPVYIQGGHFFWAGGEEVPQKDVPKWAIEAANGLTEETRREVGLASTK